MQKDLKKAMLTGRIITEEGLPLEGATVYLTDYVTTKTDINGIFLFNYLRYGKYKIKVEKEGYTPGNYDLVFNYKHRKLPMIKIKLFSLNYLVNEGFENLKEKQLGKMDEILTKIESINPDEEVYLYLKSLYFYETKKFDEAMLILEDLKIKDRYNIYYQLTLAKVYEALGFYEKQAVLLEYTAKNNLNEYYKLLKDAAEIYRDMLNDNEKYETLMKAFNDYKDKFKN